jgi:hypothetical protein
MRASLGRRSSHSSPIGSSATDATTAAYTLVFRARPGFGRCATAINTLEARYHALVAPAWTARSTLQHRLKPDAVYEPLGRSGGRGE